MFSYVFWLWRPVYCLIFTEINICSENYQKHNYLFNNWFKNILEHSGADLCITGVILEGDAELYTAGQKSILNNQQTF